jgi:predicted metal-dependent phosphoesterase TrpH
MQLHTIHSDGQWQPDELIRYLAGHGFAVAAITDHDTLEHTDEIRALGAAAGMQIVPATEITATWRGLPVHLLCYAAAFSTDDLRMLAAGIRERQLANTRDVHAELLRQGYAFPLATDVLAHQNGMVVRPIDNARLLLTHEYARDLDDALAMIREAGYRQVSAPLDEAIAAAHASGAITVLGHPGRGGGELHRFDLTELAHLVAELPLDGIEVYYPAHTPEQVAGFASFARDHRLLVSAGSDSHGPLRQYPVAYPASQIQPFLERCGILVVQD